MLLLLALSTQAHATAQRVSPPYEANCQAPRWSPDGNKLAWEVNYHDRKVVEQYIFDPGSGPVRVQPSARGASSITAGFTTATSDQVVHELAWSPVHAGSYVYAASGADGDYDLHLSTGSELAPHPGTDGGASWSPDGRWIAFTSARTGQGDVYLLDAERLDAPPKRVTSDPVTSELYLSWSADSEALAYVGHTDKGDSIWIIDDVSDPDPALAVQLGNTQTRPSFSPDGRHLAFYSNHQQRDRFDLMVMPVGGEPRTLVKGVVMNSAGPAWTPDGSAIVHVLDDDDRFDPLYIAPIGGGASKPIPTRTVGNGDHDLVKGPDGQVWLAVAAQGELTGEGRDFKRIYVMPLP